MEWVHEYRLIVNIPMYDVSNYMLRYGEAFATQKTV